MRFSRPILIAALLAGCATAPADAGERVSLDGIARQAQPKPLDPQHGVHHHG